MEEVFENREQIEISRYYEKCRFQLLAFLCSFCSPFQPS
ncbi:Uncharacterised protein [Segatella copri]|nr:Uncharacterised protein [Segatella copri]